MGLLSMGAGPDSPTQYRVRVQTSLDTDDWASGYGYQIEQTDLRHRLQLDIQPGDSDGGHLSFDLLAGTDLGPGPSSDTLDRPLRRTQLDIYRAQWVLPTLLPKTRLTLGRQIFWDLLGMGGLDGVSFDLRPRPWINLTAHGGLALRDRWSNLGPSMPEPIAETPNRIGYIVGGTIGLRPHRSTALKSTFRRQFDSNVQSEELGWSLAWAPGAGLHTFYSGIADLVFLNLVDTQLGAQLRWRGYSLGATASYQRPRFSADSIWAAFAPAPFHGLDLNVAYRGGPWSASAAFEIRQFQPNASESADLFDLDEMSANDRAVTARYAATYRWSQERRGGAVGIYGRASDGFGGRYGTGALRAQTPINTGTPVQRLFLDTHLGCAWFEEPHRNLWTGGSGWGRAALAWLADEGLTFDAGLDSFFGPATQTRLRFSFAVRMDNSW